MKSGKYKGTRSKIPRKLMANESEYSKLLCSQMITAHRLTNEEELTVDWCGDAGHRSVLGIIVNIHTVVWSTFNDQMFTMSRPSEVSRYSMSAPLWPLWELCQRKYKKSSLSILICPIL